MDIIDLTVESPHSTHSSSKCTKYFLTLAQHLGEHWHGKLGPASLLTCLLKLGAPPPSPLTFPFCLIYPDYKHTETGASSTASSTAAAKSGLLFTWMLDAIKRGTEHILNLQIAQIETFLSFFSSAISFLFSAPILIGA